MRYEKKWTPNRQEVARENPDPEAGLTAGQVAARQEAGWVNVTPKTVSKTPGEIILSNCLTFFNLVFGVLALALVLVGSHVKNLTFLVVVIINTVIGCVQEIRAKRAVDKLTLVARQTLPAVRDGNMEEVPTDCLVRDDIVKLAPGNQIPADGILRRGTLYVNEALVTGEEDLIVKMPGDELLSGSFVAAGEGVYQLTKVGVDAFAAGLALSAKADPRAAKSEMMKALDKLIRIAGIVLVPIGLILFSQEFWILHLSLRESVEDTVPALVGMIPEGLYLLTSIAMAASAIKLTGQKVLVQDMNCIETLARVDVLCVDKTGTITESVMEVEGVRPLTKCDAGEILSAFYAGSAGENDTSRAIKEAFSTQTDWVCEKEIPFTSQKKWSGKAFQGKGSFVVGAPEFVMGGRFGEIREQVEAGLSEGLRVLLLAGYDSALEENLQPDKVRPLALILLRNRIRKEAPDTFAYFEKQGVAIKVISGDNPLAVSKIAARAHIPGAESYVDATTLATDEEIAAAASRYTVFGRVTPEQKRKLIASLKQQGHTVAMTGDGVNDVLAMKESDCSIAMASGAQAASQVAKMVLLKSDFAAIPSIVGEGRRVINNIQRAASLFLVKNIFSLGTAVLVLVFGWAYPIEAFHLTIVSALTIGVPSFFLALEPNYERVEGKFLQTVLSRALPGGVSNIIMVILAQAVCRIAGIPGAQTAAICAGLLGMVGLVVLYKTSIPFDKFRALIFAAMAVALAGCFTLLRSLFDLTVTGKALLVFVCLLAVTPLVFAGVQALWSWARKKVRRKS